MLSRDLREIVAEDDYNVVFSQLPETEPLTDRAFHFIRRRNHPRYAKYYNKLALGGRDEEVRELMVQDGVDPSVGLEGGDEH